MLFWSKKANSHSLRNNTVQCTEEMRGHPESPQDKTGGLTRLFQDSSITSVTEELV